MDPRVSPNYRGKNDFSVPENSSFWSKFCTNQAEYVSTVSWTKNLSRGY